MLKRNSNYGEVVEVNNTQQPATTTTTTRNKRPLADGSSRSPPVRRQSKAPISSILVKLSESCTAHLQNCHKDRQEHVVADDGGEDIPDQCKTDLANLRNLLPEIEKKFRPAKKGNASPKPHDITQLCAFYNSAMQGNYCPFAPNLFHHGKSPRHVLTRVKFLFQHLISPSMIDVAKREELVVTGAEDEAGQESTLQAITRTVAHFLSFLAGSSIRSKVTIDLVNVLEDVRTLLRKRVVPVRLSLFDETIQFADAGMDFFLDLYQPEQIWTIHLVSFMILEEFLVDVKGKGVQVDPSNAHIGSCGKRVPPGWIDLYLCGCGKRLTNKIIFSLKLALKLTKPSGVATNLFVQTKVAASSLLITLVSDWSRRVPSPTSVLEYSIIVGEAIKSYLNSVPEASGRLSQNLRILLRKTILEPPITTFSAFDTRPARVNLDCSLNILLDCIAGIARKSMALRDELDAMVITTIHFLFLQRKNRQTHSAYCLANGAISSLISLLSDTRMSNQVLGILSLFLSDAVGPTKLNAIFTSLVEATWRDGDKDQDCADGYADASTAGLKRKRRSMLSSTTGNERALRAAPSHERVDSSTADIKDLAAASASWEPCLRSFLLTGVLITNQILGNEADSVSERARLSIEDFRTMAMALRFLTRLVVSFAWGTIGNEAQAPLFTLASGLLEALVKYARGLCNEVSDGDKSLEDVNIIIDVALEMHYFIGENLTRNKNEFHLKAVEYLLVSSQLARNYVRRVESFGTKGIHTFLSKTIEKQSSVNIVSLATLDPLEANRSIIELELDVTGAVDNSFQSSAIRNLFCLEWIYALSVGVRCCLLLSLYPECCMGDGSLSIPQSTESILIFYTSFLETKPTDSPIFDLPSLLASIPRLIRSAVGSTSGMDGAAVCDFLSKLISGFVSPIVKRLDREDSRLCQSLLCLTSNFQVITRNPDAVLTSSSLRFDALAVAEHLGISEVGGKSTGMRDFGQRFTELDIQVKRLVNRLVRDTCDHSDPVIRKLRWSCLAMLALDSSVAEIREPFSIEKQRPTAHPEDEILPRKMRPQTSFTWLVEVAFTECDRSLREAVSKDLWRLFLSENESFLLTHFASEETLQPFLSLSRLHKDGNTTTLATEHAAGAVISEFFRLIDKFLHSSIGVSDSQLSFTMNNSSSASTTNKVSNDPVGKYLMEKTAARVLSSFCLHANNKSTLGRLFFDKAFQRLVRMWAAPSIEQTRDPPFSSSKAIAFSELWKICGKLATVGRNWWGESPRFLAAIISDILLLKLNDKRDWQFLQLEGFFRSLVSTDFCDPIPSRRTLEAVQSHVDMLLPSLIVQFVDEKSLELLRLVPAFRSFLEERTRFLRKVQSGVPKITGSPNAVASLKYSSTTSSVSNLRRFLNKLCLETKVLERTLPILFLRMDRTGLSFYTKEVLNGAMISNLLKDREQVVLKGLVWELGRGPQYVGPAKVAIRTAAIARSLDGTGASQTESNRSSSTEVNAGKQWVTSNFMFLLVTLVQSRWKARPINDKVHAIRCLHGMLDFLVAEEAPNYFAPILTTVNASILAGDEKRQVVGGELEATLCLYAVKSMSKYIRLLVDIHLETIAVNLTTIIVSLIPLVDENGDGQGDHSQVDESRIVAVSLLEFLTSGQLGLLLTEPFKDIPFLPNVQCLEQVHRYLRSNGVDFDNLVVLSKRRTSQQVASNIGASDFSGTVRSANSIETETILALQKRLNLIYGHLESESSSVRSVALRHLTDLLRGNREAFRALVLSEGAMSGRRYLTVSRKESNGQPKWSSRGAVVKMMEMLLSRCVYESDEDVKLRLAVCLGEVGAISETTLGELKITSLLGDDAIDSPSSFYSWRLDQPPWQSQVVKYELQMITKHLVIALKAARSSTDQHKIAFAVQQILHMLDFYGRKDEQNTSESSPRPSREMSKWLKDQLEHSGVVDLIAPYFASEFKEKSSEAYSLKKPPFFVVSSSYFTWMSSFCRWMIQGSKRSDTSPKEWRELFFACRTVVRTEAALNVSEFVIPLLVLDRICFGTPEDRLLVQRELTDVLKMGCKVYLEMSERQRAVNTVFLTIDTLQVWLDRELEERAKRKPAASQLSRGTGRRKHGERLPSLGLSAGWPVEDAIERITELLKAIPFELQASAAECFGMNACALQRLELQARASSVLHIFETSIEDQKKAISRIGSASVQTTELPTNGFNIELLKRVLSKLDDLETMSSIAHDSHFLNPLQQIRDNIREKQALGNYESVLEEYERALQGSLPGEYQGFERGLLHCLMELGRYESVINQSRGLRHTRSGNDSYDETEDVTSFAVEASWKLGRWQALSEILSEREENEQTSLSKGIDHRISMGLVFLSLHRKDLTAAESSLKSAREIVMHRLSVIARESYGKSYDEIVQLQALRELENASEMLVNDATDKGLDFDSQAHSTGFCGWGWKGRIDVVSARGSIEIINTRVAMARLHSNPVLVGSLLLEAGHRARKNRWWTVSENFLTQAQATLSRLDLLGDKVSGTTKIFDLVNSSLVQLAKVKYSTGDISTAVKMLGNRMVDSAVSEMTGNVDKIAVLRGIAAKYEKCLLEEVSGKSECNLEDDVKLVSRFSSRLLQLTRWDSEIGLKSTSEIMNRFQVINQLSPEWEKGKFYFAKFIDSVMQSRMAAMINVSLGRGLSPTRDENEAREEVLQRDRISHSYTLLSMRMYAAALKIDLKHVYQALPRLLFLWFDLVSVARGSSTSDPPSKQDPLLSLRNHQNQANTFMAGQVREIPPIAFYTALPQLISRVIHEDPEASMVVRSILQRVLVKFPHQAMWLLAWLRGSKIPERRLIGEDIFSGAQHSLLKNQKVSSKLVEVSAYLFSFLRNVATYDGTPERGNYIGIKPWTHPDVDLSEFLPPLQATLAVSPTSIDNLAAKDYFCRAAPRMRTFSKRIKVMTSKAKPKQLKAYAVTGSYRAEPRSGRAAAATSNDESDIGEIHFLVKQEAKGDLRKDGRVQDLNNVVNRLMASGKDESGASPRRRRRLHLRTFAVTCLSEDIGILEWVPDTDSLRNLVTHSYNPQTSPNCPRRRGHRLANFGDASLRSNYEMCQNKFFKEGNLSKAASLFEDHCLRPFPPLLWWWFQQKFHDPHVWYEARNRFTLTAAAWSAVGHVIGLGDRHSENILVDTKSGECVHVDFDCIFDKGINLPRPEVVPFRLTANMIDAFGPSGADGVYKAGLKTAMRTLRENRDTLLSVLEPFLKDPVIDWKRQRSQQKPSGNVPSVHTDKQTKEAKRSIRVIDERLQGIYNLRNPNLKKYKARDRNSDQEDEFGHLIPLPVEGQVQRMIQEATSNENLVQLYVGWMPWV